MTRSLDRTSTVREVEELDTRGIKIRLEPSEARPAEAHFFVAVCSQQPLYGSPAFVYMPGTGNVLRDREHHIDLLEGELRKKTEWLEKTARELEELARINKAEQQKAQQAIDGLEQENERKTQWAADLEAKLDERTKWSVQLEAENQEVVANYQRLEEEHQKAQAELKKCVDLLDRGDRRAVVMAEDLGILQELIALDHVAERHGIDEAIVDAIPLARALLTRRTGDAQFDVGIVLQKLTR